MILEAIINSEHVLKPSENLSISTKLILSHQYVRTEAYLQFNKLSLRILCGFSVYLSLKQAENYQAGRDLCFGLCLFARSFPVPLDTFQAQNFNFKVQF